MSEPKGLLKRVANETGYSYGYVRLVNAGVRRNETIAKAIINERRHQIEELAGQIRHEAVTDFNEPSKTEVQ
ncbi:MAG: hypothetical protein Q8L89_04235 [Gammaproteobacteria bacterium]|nr:hypothetical protein [Gammaproteobacteria bacterium]